MSPSELPCFAHDTNIVNANYLIPVLSPENLPLTIKSIRKVLKPFRNQFDTIAFSGASGSLVSPMIAMQMKKHMALIRKATDNSHAVTQTKDILQCYYGMQNYVIIDDLISTGKTLKYIIDTIDTYLPKLLYGASVTPKCIAVVCYATFAYTWDGKKKNIYNDLNPDICDFMHERNIAYLPCRAAQ